MLASSVGDDLLNRVEILEKQMEPLEELPPRFGAVEGRLVLVERRLGSVATRLVSVATRLVSVETKLAFVDGRLGLVESQIVHLRTDMSDGFSAMRSEVQRDFLTFGEMMDERFAQHGRELRDEMRRLMAESNAQSRPLYEDLKDSIKRLGEGGFRPPQAES